MKALILQLSDIHIRRGRENPAIQRVREIVDAVQNVEYDLDVCVVVLSGDIAYGGHSDEYLAALDFVAALKERLAANLRGAPPVHVVAVPGNHDCMLDPELPGRTAVIESLLREPRDSVEDVVVQECTEVQNEFFGFLDLIETKGRAGSRLAYSYTFDVAGTTLAVQCYNTAWLSRLSEQQGSLFFPTELMPCDRMSANLVLAVCHHPVNWMPAWGNHREFRRRLELTHDLILTGHEHAAEVREAGEANTWSVYLEGGALQGEGGSDDSHFLATVLSSREGEYRVLRFGWNGRCFSEEGGRPTSGTRSLHGARLGSSRSRRKWRRS